MKHFTKILALILCLLIAALPLVACDKGTENAGTSGTTDTDGTGSGTTTSSDAISDNEASSDTTGSEAEKTVEEVASDTVAVPDTTGATVIIFSGETASVSGSGATAEGGVATVSAAGTYVLRGTGAGRVIVNAKKQDVVLVLENLNLTCSYGSPLYIKSSSTTVYLADGSENALTDGEVYTYDNEYSSAEDEEPNACLYSKSDLIIAGSGKLIVTANQNNGITGKDTLKIDGATVVVTAKNHGINGKDSLTIRAAKITVTSGGDALRSTNDYDPALGFIVIVDSDLTLTSGEDGVQAETTLTISGGTCTVTSGGGASGKVDSDTSAKGLNANGNLCLLSGAYALNCCDNAIHSNANIVIKGGTFTIATGDNGIHADENVTVSGGAITVTKSYEGIEGKSIDLTGGEISVTASDDGLNAAGGADSSGFGGPGFGGGDRFGTASSDVYIRIAGGKLYVNASGDGIDSNGNLIVSGGETYVDGPTGNGDGALDYDGTATITGGILVAVGSSGMAQNFGTASTQGSILLNFSTGSKSAVTLTDAQGNVLVSYTPSKTYNSVVISCPGLVQGGTYTVSACGQSSSVTLSSLIYGSGMGGGGGQPGGNQPGGNQPGGNRPGRPSSGATNRGEPAKRVLP